MGIPVAADNHIAFSAVTMVAARTTTSSRRVSAATDPSQLLAECISTMAKSFCAATANHEMHDAVTAMESILCVDHALSWIPCMDLHDAEKRTRVAQEIERPRPTLKVAGGSGTNSIDGSEEELPMCAVDTIVSMENTLPVAARKMIYSRSPLLGRKGAAHASAREQLSLLFTNLCRLRHLVLREGRDPHGPLARVGVPPSALCASDVYKYCCRFNRLFSESDMLPRGSIEALLAMETELRAMCEAQSESVDVLLQPLRARDHM